MKYIKLKLELREWEIRDNYKKLLKLKSRQRMILNYLHLPKFDDHPEIWKLNNGKLVVSLFVVRYSICCLREL